MNKQYVAYYRVSTQKQNASHLGLESQRKTCGDFVRHNNGVIVNEFTDVESGKSRTRKGLFDAIDYCKENKCSLVVAKLDRLARDVEFTFKILNTGIEIHFCDMPQVNTMILGVFASVAQYERELISQRTKAALKAKAARGETWDRKGNQTIHIACKESAKAKIARAKEDKTNVFFKTCMERIESKHGITFGKGCGAQWFELLAEELNAYNVQTSTGQQWDSKKCRDTAYRIKKRYGLVW